MRILSLDVGESAVKAAVLDAASAAPVGAIARSAFTPDHPTPEAAELPADHAAWSFEARYLALALSNWVCTLSPKRIIMGGGVMQQSHLFPVIRRELLNLLNGYIQAGTLLSDVDS